MATTVQKEEAKAARLTSQQVWREVSARSFAVLGYVTPRGEPRASGVVYKTLGRRLYVAVAPDSWKARHIAVSGKVSVTVPVRRGGILSLVAPIPPATVSFHGTATVYQADAAEARLLLEELGALLPTERRASASIIEVIPEGAFVTYGIGISLAKMRDPTAARSRVRVEDHSAMKRTAGAKCGPPRDTLTPSSGKGAIDASERRRGCA